MSTYAGAVLVTENGQIMPAAWPCGDRVMLKNTNDSSDIGRISAVPSVPAPAADGAWILGAPPQPGRNPHFLAASSRQAAMTAGTAASAVLRSRRRRSASDQGARERAG